MSGDKKCGFLVLEDGSRYKGTVFGGTQSVPGEVGESNEGSTPISSRLHLYLVRLPCVQNRRCTTCGTDPGWKTAY